MTDRARTGDAAGSRHVSLDVGRYLLLAGVIALHLMEKIAAADLGLWSIAVRDLANVAVPVYFLTGGYFLSWQSRTIRQCLAQPIRRLAPLYLFWLTLYIAHFHLTAGGGWMWTPYDLLNGGPGYHLWFLPALMFALILVAVANRTVGPWGALPICATLAAIGLTRGAWHDWLGMPGGAQRAGILMAPIFVWLGSAIRCHAPDRIDRRWIAALVVPALAMQAAENAVLSYLTRGDLQTVHAFPATMPLTATAMFLAIRSVPATIWPYWLVEQSRRTLGVYAGHLLVIYTIGQTIVPAGPASLLLLVAIIFAGSALLARAMTTVPPLRRFVGVEPIRSGDRIDPCRQVGQSRQSPEAGMIFGRWRLFVAPR